MAIARRPTTIVSIMALLAVAPRALAQSAAGPTESAPPVVEGPAQAAPVQAAPAQPAAQLPAAESPTAAAAQPPAAPPEPAASQPVAPPETASTAQLSPALPPPAPYEPPVPPSFSEQDRSTRIPDISVRIDPFNWILDGRLGVEIEVAVWNFISVELVPVFMADSQPPALNLTGGFPDVLKQESNGLGPLAAASLGVGFWVSGEPFDGTVLKAVYEHSGYTYRAEDGSGVIDEVTHTGRRLFGFIGAQRRIPEDGVFTIGGGVGLGVEFNEQRRCFVDGEPSTDCGGDDLLIRLDRDSGPSVANLNGPMHPAYYIGRLSLGVVF